MASKEAARQAERAFHRAFSLHLTSRSSNQMRDAIQESPLMTQVDFVAESLKVSILVGFVVPVPSTMPP